VLLLPRGSDAAAAVVKKDAVVGCHGNTAVMLTNRRQFVSIAG